MRAASVLVALLVAACGPTEPVVLDLDASRDVAERGFELSGFDPNGWSFRRYLAHGWGLPDPDGGPTWADDVEAELRLWFARPVERRLTTRAASFARPQTVRVALDGVELAPFELTTEERPIEIVLPAEAVRVGWNRLRLRFEHATPPEAGGAPRAARFGIVDIEPDFVERDTLPVHTWSEKSVSVKRGERLSCHLRVPPAARFSATTRGPRGMRFRLTVVTDDDGAAVAWEGGRGEDVDVDLDPYAGDVVRLDFTVENEGRAALGAWEDPFVRAPDPGPEPAPPPAVAPVGRVPVVVILPDALVPGALGCYGGRRGVSPRIDALAERSVVFEQATAPASYTISSIASLLTSRPTWEHRTWNWREASRPPADMPRWPRRFAEEGWRTAAVVHSPNGSSQLGFDVGFETFVDAWRPVREAEAVLGPLEEILAADDGRPLFLWLHVLEPHEPYHPPEPWRGRHDPDYDGALTGDPQTLWDIRNRVLVPSARDVAHLRAEYEDNVAYVDDVVGRVLDRLDAAGVLEDAIVALVSDHGEGFLQHDGKRHAGLGHGSTVYEEMASMPFVLRVPGLAPRRIAEPVSGLDLMPTLAALTGVAPLGGHAGRSLAPLLAGATFDEPPPVITHTETLVKTHFLPGFALRDGRFKLIATPGDAPELYDLATDPGETRDLAAELPVRVGWMRQVLRERVGFDLDAGLTVDAPDATALDRETRAQLEALGYLMGEGDDGR